MSWLRKKESLKVDGRTYFNYIYPFDLDVGFYSVYNIMYFKIFFGIRKKRTCGGDDGYYYDYKINLMSLPFLDLIKTIIKNLWTSLFGTTKSEK